MANAENKAVTIKLTLTGKTGSDLLDALDESVRLIKEGNTSGFSSNEFGSLNFEASEQILED